MEIEIGIRTEIGIVIEGLAVCCDFDLDSDADFGKQGSSV
jgi:hypothetical protein